MKKKSKIKICRERISLNFLIILLLSGFLHTFTFAQELTPKLTESEIQAVIPILKLEIAGYVQNENAMGQERDVRRALFNDIKSGKIDPLEWLKQYSKYIIVPREVIYQPACSRAASIAGWEMFMQESESGYPIAPPIQPTAIFTYGKEFSAINKNALIKRSKNIDISGETIYDINHPSYKEIRAILENARLFYSKNGFSADYNMSGDAVTFYPSNAEGEISGVVYSVYWDAYDPNFSDLRQNCKSLPSGPTIEIKAGDRLMEKYFNKLQVAGMGDGNIKKSLQKAGITEERYAEIKAGLIMARAGSQNFEEEPPALDFKPSTPEEKRMAQEIEKMRKEIRIKKENIRLYLRYKTELDPILDILQKHIGGL